MGEVIIFYTISVVSGIHGHRLDLAHVCCWSSCLLLSGLSGHQVVKSGSTLNECVERFLDTRVVEIDTRSSVGGSLNTRCNRHSALRGAVTLGYSWRRARHGWAGQVLRGGWGEGTVGLRLRGGRGQATSTY